MKIRLHPYLSYAALTILLAVTGCSSKKKGDEAAPAATPSSGDVSSHPDTDTDTSGKGGNPTVGGEAGSPDGTPAETGTETGTGTSTGGGSTPPVGTAAPFACCEEAVFKAFPFYLEASGAVLKQKHFTQNRTDGYKLVACEIGTASDTFLVKWEKDEGLKKSIKTFWVEGVKPQAVSGSVTCTNPPAGGTGTGTSTDTGDGIITVE